MKAQSTSKKPFEFKNSTKIIRLIKAGETTNHITAECNCSSSTVYFYMKKLNVKAQSVDHRHKAEIIDALREKKKWKWIEQVYNCSSSTISRYNKILKAR